MKIFQADHRYIRWINKQKDEYPLKGHWKQSKTHPVFAKNSDYNLESSTRKDLWT
jgi:hypothetical protein